MRYTGQVVKFCSQETVREPNRGYRVRVTWKGCLYGLTGNANYEVDGVLYPIATINGQNFVPIVYVWHTAGYQYAVENDGPWYTATATAFIETTPVHVYRYDTEWPQDDMINAPKIQTALAGLGEAGIATLYAKLNEYLSLPLDGDDGGTAKIAQLVATAPYNSYASIINSIVWLKRKGVQAFETRRYILGREISMTWAYWNAEFSQDFGTSIKPTDELYTKAQLGTIFGVDSNTLLRLHDATSTKPGFTWAWKLKVSRTDDQRTDNKVIINQEWVYACWATLLYDIAT